MKKDEISGGYCQFLLARFAALEGFSVTERLIVLALLAEVDRSLSGRAKPADLAKSLRVDPVRVDQTFVKLVSLNLVRAKRWDDSGAWSFTFTPNGEAK